MGYYENSDLDVAMKALEAKVHQAVDNRSAELSERLKELEQKAAGGQLGAPISFNGSRDKISREFTDHEGFKAFRNKQAGSAKIALEGDLLGIKNTITGDSGSPAEPDGVIVQPARMPGIVSGSMRRLSVFDVMPKILVGSNMVEFTRELSFTDNAAVQQGEGSSFAESSILFELAESPVRTIATYLKTSRQVLDDQPQLMRFLDMRLRHAVRRAAEQQIISGTGADQSILGMTATGNHVDYNRAATGDNQLATLRKARAQLENTDYTPMAFMINPLDAADIDLITDGQGGYLVGDPRGQSAQTLWEIPTVISSAITPGEFLCADMSGVMLWDRQAAVVEFFEQNSDDAQKGLVTVIASIRVGFSVMRPAGVVFGDLTL